MWVDNTTEQLDAAWYAVAWSHEVTDQPVAVELLGRHWVLARIGGKLAAFVDACPHRLLPLSGGRICDATLRCAYHGWEYDALGAAVTIPSLGEGGGPLPPRAHLITPGGLDERYGAIWLAPSPPVAALWEFPEWDDQEFDCRLDVTSRTTASAAQLLDNACDASHFVAVHAGSFGGDATAQAFPRTVERDGWTLTAVYDSPYRVRDDLSAGESIQMSTHTKSFHLGATMVLRMEFPETNSTFTIAIAAQPEHDGSTRLYRWFARNDIVGDEERWATCLEWEAKILAEDQYALGLFRDHRLPLDLQSEVHVRADKFSLTYRRLLREFLDRVPCDAHEAAEV